MATKRRLAGPAAVLTLLLAAGLLPLTTTAASAAERPAIVPDEHDLSGVYCTSSINCWAVGEAQVKTSAWVNQVRHWNGKSWTAVTVPSPAGTTAGSTSDLRAVRCVSATSCWAVGYYLQQTSAEFSEALHWDGKKWTTATVPHPAGTQQGDYTVLNDVACTGPGSCWAAGDQGTNLSLSEQSKNFVVHWNGKAWAQVKTPNPAGTASGDGNDLAAIRCTSAASCWAGGTAGSPEITLNEMLHWNGKKWTEADVPQPAGFMIGSYNAIGALSCTSPNDCWAVGSYGGGSVSDTVFLNQAMHWDGKQWQTVTMPNPDGTGTGAENVAMAVNCSSAANCWTVGYYGTAAESKPVLNEALHWKGTKWVTTKVPSPGGTVVNDTSKLFSVRCVSARYCWAVGLIDVPDHQDQNESLHWNSRSWSAG
jgi:hypothetical protein